MPRPSKAAGSVALVTGANRGIGLAFVQELAARGARKVYAGVRSPGDVTDQFKELPVEVVPLDVTDLALVQAAAAGCPAVTDRQKERHQRDDHEPARPDRIHDRRRRRAARRSKPPG